MKKEMDKTCGIVMPISTIGNCTEAHWAEVHEILLEAIEDAGFRGDLVSNADDVGIIHKRIVQNLYENPIVVCDVSMKNPNVMFELGLRLAFDKPTIIVKDEETPYSFDTSSIEHLDYPRDLRFSKIVDFKKKLSEKIKATYEKSQLDPEYSTFLKSFGQFKVAKLEAKEIPGQEYILEELKNIRRTISRIDRTSSKNYLFDKSIPESDVDICLKGVPSEKISEIFDFMMKGSQFKNVGMRELASGHHHLVANTAEGIDSIDAIQKAYQIIGKHQGPWIKKSGSKYKNFDSEDH